MADRRHQVQHCDKEKTAIPNSVIGSFSHAGLKSNWELHVQWELVKKSSRGQLWDWAGGEESSSVFWVIWEGWRVIGCALQH